jgi:hypothetical protein
MLQLQGKRLTMTLPVANGQPAEPDTFYPLFMPQWSMPSV